jgi:hypothetical protein
VGGASACDSAVTATDDDLVEAITSALRPWAPQRKQLASGFIAEKSEAEVTEELSAVVRGCIDLLRQTVPDYFSRDAIRKTRDEARDIATAIDRVTELLSAKTISPELRLRLGMDTPMTGDPAEITNRPIPRLLDALHTVRVHCQAGADNQPNADQVKLWCVRSALNLVLGFSECRPSAGSAKTSYCVIASLLYESVTGEKELQLRRICQDVLRPYLPLLPG